MVRGDRTGAEKGGRAPQNGISPDVGQRADEAEGVDTARAGARGDTGGGATARGGRGAIREAKGGLLVSLRFARR